MQCEATTLTSTYSSAHRCLKVRGVKKVASSMLCLHHRVMRMGLAARRIKG
jgi:hypothetical protein